MKIEFCLSHFTFCLMVNYWQFETNCRRNLIGCSWKSKNWTYPNLRFVTYS